MKYHVLINKIKKLANSRDGVSQDALELVVENVAMHLTDYTRRGFAAKLPEELRSAAMMVPTASTLDDDIIEQFMDIDDVDERSARDYVRAAWQAISELFDRESVEDITAELPRRMVAVLE
ncbi:DUF2267 domain-containing protein [Candidatus Saccharibacteria bacterium]|nr:MAG: DUF2267 domain-containing protein [Candidatus Saccharibacteria bacterium]